MDTPKHCQSCQAPLAADAPRGLCPACLMKVAMATGTAAGPEKPGFTPPSVEELARKFPQLEIIELIGRGGMGAVYKARQKELDRIVALKILPPGIGEDAAFAERFAREAKALARLNHPGIITIHDFGRADGLYFFVMEFVDGVNLRQLLASSRVSPREALAIVPQICDALQFAHDQGIVHRDIKPENILLDRRGRVKVADFGLAKIIEGRAGSPLPAEPGTGTSDGAHGVTRPTSELTAAGKVMGTPAYMAPEQVEHPAEVDHRADIYALGVVFYQMLTGELPGKRIEAPSKKVQIDVRLDEVVLRALERKPELRYQQVSEVKTCVETILNSESTNVPSTGQVEAPGSTFSWIGSFPKLNGPFVVKRGIHSVINWPVTGVNLLHCLFWICVGLPIMLKGLSYSERNAHFIELGFIGLCVVFFLVRLVHGFISPAVSPPGERGVARGSSSIKARRKPFDCVTWSPFQSPEVQEICAHLTDAERKTLASRAALSGVWLFVVPFLAMFAAIQSGKAGFMLLLLGALAVLYAAFVVITQHRNRAFLCSTDWARKQGITPEKLRLFSFSARPVQASASRPDPGTGRVAGAQPENGGRGTGDEKLSDRLVPSAAVGSSRRPWPLIIVAVLFILTGCVAAWDIGSNFHNHVYSANISLLGLSVGIGLLRLRPRWRIAGLIMIWLPFILGACLGIAALFGQFTIQSHATFFGFELTGVLRFIATIAACTLIPILLVWMSRILTRSDVKALFHQAAPDRPWLEWAALPAAIMIASVLSSLTGPSGTAQFHTADPLPEGSSAATFGPEFRRLLADSIPVKEYGYTIKELTFSQNYQQALVVFAHPESKTRPQWEFTLSADDFGRYFGMNMQPFYTPGTANTPAVYITVDLAPWPRPPAVQPGTTLGPAYGHEREFRQQLADSVPMNEYGYTIKDLRFSKDYQKALVVFAHADSKARPRWEFTLTSDTFGRYRGMNMQPFYTPGTANTPGIYITVDLAGK